MTREMTAIQSYDMPRIHESELAQMDLPIAVAELVDNAIDETPQGATCEVTMTFDARDGRVVFENRNTTGMDPAKLNNFVQWGQEHTNPGKLKEHGQGGKLAALFMIKKDGGSVTITSAPKHSPETYQMHLTDWWHKQTHGEKFPIDNWPNSVAEAHGFTRFEMQGVKDGTIPPHLAELADNMGFIYGPLISASRLSLRLRRISKSGKVSDDFDVLPVVIPFDGAQLQPKKEIGIDGGRVKLTVLYGQIDPTERENSARRRRNLYKTQKVNEPQGEVVRIYNHGKLLSEEPLSRFGITRKKMSLYGFTAAAYITEGFVKKTILKTGLNKTDPVTAKIIEAIKRTITPYITSLLAESYSKTVSESDKKRAAEATNKLALVLLNMFGRDTNKIRFELNLPSDIYPTETSTVRDRKIAPGTQIKSLPGIRGDKLEPKEFKVGRTITPFPEVRIAPFGQIYPNASLRRDDVQNQLVIALNYDSPDVRIALETRGLPGLAQILRISAGALYHQKWISAAGNDAELYSNGVQSDIAEFMNKAKEMKII